jgi:putative membrane protein
VSYLWLKTFHIAAAITWVGGMLAAAICISFFTGRTAERPLEASVPLQAFRKWDRCVSSPAMLLVWILGLALAEEGEWVSMKWLLAKLVLVLLLSALHGFLSGTLGRLSRSDNVSFALAPQYAPATIIACAAAIVTLVVLKPF